MELGRTAKYYRSNPKARQRHRDYMADYNATPEKKAYRRRLAAARRARGIMGKGGGDLSHTAAGRLRIKPRSKNRAANGHGNNSRYA